VTIQDLLDTVLPDGPCYDAAFAEEFQFKVQEVLAYRTDLNQNGIERSTVLAAYRDSWSALLSYFADDPASLAAFTAPRLHISPSLECAYDVDAILPDTLTGTPTTLMLYLYEAIGGGEGAVGLKSRAKKTLGKPKGKATRKKASKKKASKR
jgi:hypothetical protein